MAKKTNKRPKKAVKKFPKRAKKPTAAKSAKQINNPVIDDIKMFSTLLPPLAKDVYEALKESIRKDGLREPLTVWKWNGKRILVDGHNRLKICNRLKIPYRIHEKSFENEEEVKSWMWENQESRRNMTPYQRIEVVLQFKGVVREQARKKQGGAVCENFHKAANRAVNRSKLDKIRTNEVLGKSAGVSYPQVGKVLKIQEKIAEGVINKEVLDQLRNGDVSIDRVFKEFCKVRNAKQQQTNQDIEKRTNRFMNFIKIHAAKAFPQMEDSVSLYDKIIEWASAKREGLREPSE